MISAREEEHILRKAYVPEHIVSLMSLISGGEPFLHENYLFWVKNSLLMFIGFPLGKDFKEDEFLNVLGRVTDRFSIEDVRLIAPVLPESMVKSCRSVQSDHYFRLDIDKSIIKNELKRVCEKASKVLSLEMNKDFTRDHQWLVDEFTERVNPGEQVKALYKSMEGFVQSSESSYVLNARDKNGNLSAFYVFDTAATEFITYLVGCHSKRHYVSHASDLLMGELIRLCGELSKKYINLGIGVNDGIRKFKEKWGGIPFLSYEYCERAEGSGLKRGFMDYLRSKL